MAGLAQLSEFAERADVWRCILGCSGAGLIVWAQVYFDITDARFFSLFFWCIAVTRFLGALAAVCTLVASVIMGNIFLLEPRGAFSLAGQSGYLSLFFAVMASMCIYMIVAIQLHVRRQQNLLDRAQQTAKHNKSLADALGKAVSARDTFLAVAGHELKSPVTGLMLQTQVWQRRLARRTVEPQEMRKAWTRQSEALGRLASLVDNLLDVSRINGGQLQLNRCTTNFSAMVTDVAGRFNEQAGHAGCTLDVDVQPNVVGDWDKVRLEQVVANLLSNAVKYGAGAPIELRLRQQDDTADLYVVDHGKGISAADKERIFECFERVSTENHVEGLGLGLWIVRQIVDASGGRIAVKSEEGQGATFRVSLPVRVDVEGGQASYGHLAVRNAQAAHLRHA